jgi:CO/xanthine dehydrogenase Mo-binding subunit
MTRLEERLRIEPDGTVVALSGKVEYGQGIRTAFAGMVAEELGLDPDAIQVVLGDTAAVPYDAGTYGSFSTRTDGVVLAQAAAIARRILLERAAERLGTTELEIGGGEVRARDGRKLGFGELVAGAPLTGDVPEDTPVRPVSRQLHHREARAIVMGEARYVADMRVPGMLRGAVLHPPVHGARLRNVDEAAARAVPGVTHVIRQGDFVGVLADASSAAARAGVAALAAEWDAPAPVTGSERCVVLRDDAHVPNTTVEIEAEYEFPRVANAPIGTSVALAEVRADGVTIHAATQRPFGIRDVLANVMRLPPEQIRVIAGLTTGTYGRNNAPEVAIEAARLSRAAGAPVLVEWSRADELRASPHRPEVDVQVRAGLSASGQLVWSSEVVTEPHVAGPEGMTLPDDILAMTAGRNAVPAYDLAGRVELRVIPAPVKTGALRSLAGAPNVFAIESAIDELALKAGEDPLALRLRFCGREPRLRRALERVAEQAGWGKRRGLGIACAEYHDSYVAIAAEVDVASSGKVRLARAWCAVDAGVIVNPDGAKSQIEGGIVQGMSWTLLEELRHKDGRVLAAGWDAYPIATFRDAPASIEIVFTHDGKARPTGVGEVGAVPIGAAIANAVVSAGGARVRRLPLTPARVRR